MVPQSRVRSACMRRLGVIAALAGELKPLVRGWQASRFERGAAYTRQRDGWGTVAVHGGMGREAAAAAFLRAMQDGRLDAVVSIGWAGSLSAKAAAGTAYCVNGVIDGSTGERYATEAGAETDEAALKLVTMKRVIVRSEKQRVADDFDAQLVDMEAATVARLARVHDIPFYCYKAVSDGVDENLPDMNPFIRRDGRMNMTGFITSAMVRPRYWPSLIRMGKNSASGAAALAQAVEQLAAELAAK